MGGCFFERMVDNRWVCSGWVNKYLLRREVCGSMCAFGWGDE